jgi:uncharacterized membrane protein YqiK
MRKAQGMSLNVIVVAVIVLIILVVLVLVFTGKIKLFGSKTTETAAQYSGSKCKVPGTNNECLYEGECRSRGGSWSAAPDGVSDYDCPEGCCYL